MLFWTFTILVLILSLRKLRGFVHLWFRSSLGCTKSKVDSKIYYKVEDGNPMILLLYVDDMFVTGMDGLIFDTKRKLLPSLK